MSSNLRDACERLREPKHYERLKLFFLSITFFMVIAAYSIIRDLKNSIFSSVVGADYIPYVKICVWIFLIPAILFYSKIVDKVRRYNLLITYSLVYAVLCLFFAFFLLDPVRGLENTNQSPYRLFGWIFFIFAEGFSPFVLGVFWAFSNSINSPESAKNNYGIMVSGSKLGGMFSTGLAWLFFGMHTTPFFGKLTDAGKHSVILIFASICLFIIPVLIYALMKVVPGKYLHGYESAYKAEKERGKRDKAATGMFAGLWMILKYPYVLGIFSMIFFYEILNTIMSLLRVKVAQSATSSVGEMSQYLLGWVFVMHFVGFLVSLIGTSALMRKLGTKTCVMLIPISMGAMVLAFIMGSSPFVLMATYTLMKMINYAFSSPVMESLYIPTLKDIKFKSKSWIDAFGSKFAKSSGSTINILMGYLGPALLMPVYSLFFAVIIGVWFVAALLLGRRFDKAIENKEVVGLSDDDDREKGLKEA